MLRAGRLELSYFRWLRGAWMLHTRLDHKLTFPVHRLTFKLYVSQIETIRSFLTIPSSFLLISSQTSPSHLPFLSPSSFLILASDFVPPSRAESNRFHPRQPKSSSLVSSPPPPIEECAGGPVGVAADDGCDSAPFPGPTLPMNHAGTQPRSPESCLIL